MTTQDLRDYFAAHAPVVPTWFKPDLPKKPVCQDTNEFTEEEEALMDEHFDFDNDRWKKSFTVQSELRSEIDRKLASNELIYKEHYKRVDEFEDLNLDMMAMAQWSYVYADGMLAEKARTAKKPLPPRPPKFTRV